MNCSVAIQYLPLDAATDEEVCRIVDAVIAYIDSTGIDYFVGPFETAIEGDYDECMCIGQHVEYTSEIGTFKIITHDFNDGICRMRFKLG